MKTNKAGIDLIKKFEGLRLMAYADPATGGEPWTIGYGHTSAAGLPKVYKGLKITATEAELILVKDLASYEASVLKAITRIPTGNQFAAMVSLCYNIGATKFTMSSICKNFNSGNTLGAANSFPLWNKGAGVVMKGLVARRAAERLLFLTPDSTVVTESKPVEVPPVVIVEPVKTDGSKSLLELIMNLLKAIFGKKS